MKSQTPAEQSCDIDLEQVAQICRKLSAGKPVRRRLGPDLRVVLDRPLPFLLVYRTPADRADPATASLIRGEASFVVAPAALGTGVGELIARVGATLSDQFGALLLIEIWSDGARSPDPDELPVGPGFRVVVSSDVANRSSVGRLVRSLAQVKLFRRKATVSLEVVDGVAPPGLAPLLSRERAEQIGAVVVGVEVRAVYRGPDDSVYPMARRSLQRQLGRSLRRAAFEFSRRETSHRPKHFESLGRRAFTKLVWDADRRLAEISRSFDLLLVVTPVNSAQAYAQFEASGFERAPRFLYRPRTIDPPILKRDLYGIPIERIDDPTLAFLFEEKRRELDLKLTLIEERHSRRFLPTGLALYGTVDPPLVAEARGLLERFPPSPSPAGEAQLDAAGFAGLATELLERLRQRAPGLTSRVELRDDIASLTVSNGNLLVGRSLTFPTHRVEALLQHEVGTHIVTHWNGSAQPFQLLAAGLAGYDELQEGLAVFAEYLVGGLGPGRLRTLAARVMAAQMLVEGASFVETFRELRREGFGARATFTDTLRVHRSGGFVKDAVYLRGLRSILGFVQTGGRLRSLLVGKVATDHVPMLEELQHRKVLRPLALLPPYLEEPLACARLERARAGLAVHQLVD